MRTCRLSCCGLVIVSGLMVPGFVRAAENLPAEAALPTGDVMLLPVQLAPAVEPDEGCFLLGEDGTGLTPNPNRFRGNVLDMVEDGLLVEVQVLLKFSGTADLYFSIHQRCAEDPGFIRLLPDKVVTADGGDDVELFYSSGIYNPPVPLIEGCRYAIGIGWGNRQIRYYRHTDENAYPMEFEDGGFIVIGSTGADIPPPAGDQFNYSIFENGVYTFQVCLAPKPGACCLPGDECANLISAECQAESGIFTAPRVLCRDVQFEGLGCPLIDGACCLPGGGCVNVDKFSCLDNEGLWHRRMVCADDPCTSRGACCLDGGGCEDLTEAACEAHLPQPGVYQGDGNLCEDYASACLQGACCVGETCIRLTEPSCADVLGIWRGHGTNCAGSNPCAPPGACCTVDGCLDGDNGMTAQECAAVGGTYQGDWSTCDTIPALCGKGACCVPGVGCWSDLDMDLCQFTLNGIYQGDGSGCDELDPACLGSCCAAGACWPETAPRDCPTLPGGIFGGYTPCPIDPEEDPDPCADLSGAKACCLPDGSCVTTKSLSDCTAIAPGATWDDSGTCSAVTCPVPVSGACCLGEECAETTNTECGGIFTPDVGCTLDFCTVGACCSDTLTPEGTTCIEGVVTLEACASAGGNFYARRTCDICPSAGACCKLGLGGVPTCIPDLTRAACLAQSGVYSGDGSQCAGVDPVDCDNWACCLGNGTCAEITRDECAIQGGQSVFGFTCDAQVCPSGGACCLDEDDCHILTRTACIAAQGVYAGDHTECEPGACAVGACCGADCTCADVFPSECSPSAVFDPFSECDDDNCPPCGACCFYDDDAEEVVCAARTQAGCDALQGSWAGLGTACQAETCQTGACCLAEGVCVLALEAECTRWGATFVPGADCSATEICRGACCLIDGSCVFAVNQGTCDELGGLFDGQHDCGDQGFTCPVQGACCRDDESCDITTEALCDGIFLPDQKECSPADLCFRGGCCRLDRCEPDIIESMCLGEWDEFRETDRYCQQACPNVGACCHPDQPCEITYANLCTGESDYFAPGAACFDDACASAACCGPQDHQCTVMTALECAQGSGVFQPDSPECNYKCEGTDWSCVVDDDCKTCSDDPTDHCASIDDCKRCRDSGVRCVDDSECDTGTQEPCLLLAFCRDSQQWCVNDNDCDVGTQEPCVVLVTCDPTLPCVTELCALEACCTVDGDCVEVVESECRAEGFHPGQTCADVGECPPVCCQADGQCALTSDCQGEGGEPIFGVYTCAEDPCAVGACCRPGGSCVNLERKVICENDRGVFQGAGTVCADALCHACCLDDGTCVNTASNFGDELACEGVLVGALRCEDDPCPGACCKPNGECQDGTTLEACLLEDGWFYQAQLCPPAADAVTCPAEFAACCLDGRCVTMSPDDCTADGGVYHSQVTSCANPDICTLGACCAGDGDCTDLVVESQCNDSLDEFYPGDTCWVADCVPRGACCRNWACLDDVTQEFCEAGFGVFQGGGKQCADDQALCDLGACCRANGDCVDVQVASQCTGVGDEFTPLKGCLAVDCGTKGACCVAGLCELLTETECTIAGGVYHGDDTTCDRDPCLEIVSSNPPCGAIDAAQPHPIEMIDIRQGWDSIELTFSGAGSVEPLRAGDFTLTEVGGDAIVPAIVNVSTIAVDAVLLELDEPIEPGAWTIVTYDASDTKTCVGFLPADVDQSMLSEAQDIDALIACLNGAVACESWQADTNRSTAMNAQDILRVIDLLNGADEYETWSAQTLSPIPCTCP